MGSDQRWVILVPNMPAAKNLKRIRTLLRGAAIAVAVLQAESYSCHGLGMEVRDIPPLDAEAHRLGLLRQIGR